MKRAWLISIVLCCGVLSTGMATSQGAPPEPAKTPYVKDPKFWPMPVMDTRAPVLPPFRHKQAVLIFSKTNGFRDDEQIKAANITLSERVKRGGRDVYVTENAAVFNPAQLAKFDVIALNSISGNVFLPEQRAAFKQWLERGGGVVALHGSGGDHEYDWDWYVKVMLGAQFIGHTSKPNQFQPAIIRVVNRDNPAMTGLPSQWQRTDEWYAFDRIPTGYHTHILAVLDENSYHPAPEQVMGLHPIIWTRCIGRGRVFFSALGHKAETYSEAAHLKMIDGALDWASQAKQKGCGA